MGGRKAKQLKEHELCKEPTKKSLYKGEKNVFSASLHFFPYLLCIPFFSSSSPSVGFFF
jgi:hypothetical protein